jgi:hypothetical protein
MIVIVAAVLVMVCLYFIKDLCKLQVDDTPHDYNNAVSKALHKIVQVAKQLPWNKLRIPLVVMQLLTQFIAISGTQYPSIYANCIKWFNVVNLDTSWLLSAGCILHVNFYDKLLLTTLAPLVIALIILVIHCRARYICYKKTDLVEVLAHAKAKHLSVFLTFTFLIYSTVSTVVFQTFACDYLEDTKESWLRADYSISCDTDTHAVFRKYAIVMVVLYPIGILAIYTGLLIRHRHNLNPTTTATTATAITDIDVVKPTCLRALLNPVLQSFKGYYGSTAIKANATVAAADNQQQQQPQQQQPQQQEQLDDTRQNDTSLTPIKFLWSPYRQEVYWWELVECIRRLLLTGFLVFILPGTAGQSAVACVFAGLSLGVFGLVQPFADTSDSNDYWFGTWILFLSTFIALVLKGDNSSESAYYNKFMAIILVVFNVLLISSAAIQGMYTALVTARAAWRANAANA